MGLTAGAILIVLGFVVPALLVLALVWDQERRRSYGRLKLGRLVQDNRGLKLALNKTPAGALPLTFADDHERQEFLELAGSLAANGTLLDWLRLGTKPPLDAGARLLGVNERDAIALRQAVADWTAQGILAVLDRVKIRFTHIADMERVWTVSAGEVNLRPVIDQAMWVFEPEIVVTESGQAVSATATLARATTDLSFDPSRSVQDSGGKILVEMRDVRSTVGSEDQLQAWNDVRELMKAGAIRERDAVDVYVIGGSVDDLDGNPRIEGRNRNVRITSCDYGQVIGRAKRLTLGLYDDLQEAPFLCQYRADAEAAASAEIEHARLARQQLRASADHDRHAQGDDGDDRHDRHGHDDHGRHAEAPVYDEDRDDGHDAPEAHGESQGGDRHDVHAPGDHGRDERRRPANGLPPKKVHMSEPVDGGRSLRGAVVPPAPVKPPRRFLRNAAQ